MASQNRYNALSKALRENLLKRKSQKQSRQKDQNSEKEEEKNSVARNNTDPSKSEE